METEKKRAWLTGAHIKWIAIAAMAVDHTAAALMEPVLLSGISKSATDLYVLSWVYLIMRGIGRFAFPVFCFLLVEGFFHTKNRKNYMRNLLIFALLSEIPFDWALFGKPFDWQNQNVFWTLLAGFIAVWISEYCMQKSLKVKDRATLYYVLMVASLVILAVAAELFHTDYGAIGVAVIFVMYAMHNKPVMGALFSWMMLTLLNGLEAFSLPYVLAVKLYNGQRGKQIKYLFYAFYPVHLFILALVRFFLF